METERFDRKRIHWSLLELIKDIQDEQEMK